jgi:hypothetical protein
VTKANHVILEARIVNRYGHYEPMADDLDPSPCSIPALPQRCPVVLQAILTVLEGCAACASCQFEDQFQLSQKAHSPVRSLTISARGNIYRRRDIKGGDSSGKHGMEDKGQV